MTKLLNSPYGLDKILSASQTREADAFTIQNEPISSLELMERASAAFVNCIENKIARTDNVAIVCGIGNNGGDGFAISRILAAKGIKNQSFLVKTSEKLSPDCQANYDKLENVVAIESIHPVPNFDSFDIIIDAIFGSGLSRPLDGLARKVVDSINKAKKRVISVDIPSGLFADSISKIETAIKSELTISFQRPKLSFFLPESGEFIEKWKVVDIGLIEDFLQSSKSQNFILDEKVCDLLLRRKRFSHKGTYGHALLMAGSQGKMGAAILTSKACLRSGCGLLTAFVPKTGNDIMQMAIPEAMTLSDENKKHITKLPDISPYTAIGLGPGLGQKTETKRLVAHLLSDAKQPLVIDADALNILSKDKALLDSIPKNCILTPHPKEFERLAGKWENSLERLEKQKAFSKKHHCIIVLKDAHTSISDSIGNVFFNTSGNAGMATGGSGDVLTGIITGLACQGYSPIESALLGVYFHGKAGDRAKEIRGMESLIASDIIENLSFKKGV